MAAIAFGGLTLVGDQGAQGISVLVAVAQLAVAILVERRTGRP